MIVDCRLSNIGFHNLYEIYIQTDTYVLYLQYTIQSNDYGGYYGNKLYNKPSIHHVGALIKERV